MMKSTVDKSGAIEAFLSGKLAQVDINRIEKELKSLWQSASEDKESGERRSIVRACAMNLLLYSEDPDAESAAGTLLDEATMRHPCRAILVISRDSNTPTLDAWVSARCHITASTKMKQICCEQITVRGHGVGSGELASVVLPLIISDLPVFMWWRTPGLRREKLDPFLPLVDRLIIDSGCQADSLQFFKNLQGIINKAGSLERRTHRTVCSDLNWRRSLPWREALALSFDSRHSELSPDYLKGVETVEIAYGKQEDARGAESGLGLLNQSILLVGWLATRLQWKTVVAEQKEEHKYEIRFACDGSSNQIRIVLYGVPSSQAGTGDIGSVSVIVNRPERVRLLAQQERGTPGIHVSSTNDSTVQRAGIVAKEQPVLRLDEAPENTLMDKEFALLGRDPVFESAIDAAVEILELLAGGGNKR